MDSRSVFFKYIIIQVKYIGLEMSDKVKYTIIFLLVSLVMSIGINFAFQFDQEIQTITQTIRKSISAEYLWISGNDDFERKLNKTIPGGPEIGHPQGDGSRQLRLLP